MRLSQQHQYLRFDAVALAALDLLEGRGVHLGVLAFVTAAGAVCAVDVCVLKIKGVMMHKGEPTREGLSTYMYPRVSLVVSRGHVPHWFEYQNPIAFFISGAGVLHVNFTCEVYSLQLTA